MEFLELSWHFGIELGFHGAFGSEFDLLKLFKLELSGFFGIQ